MKNSVSQPEVIFVKRGRDEPVAGPSGFADRLRYCRKCANISLRDQDKYAGLSGNHSQAIDAGRRGAGIEARIVARLARVYGCSMEWLFLGIGETPRAVDLENAVDVADQRYREVAQESSAALSKLRQL